LFGSSKQFERYIKFQNSFGDTAGALNEITISE